MKCDDYFLIDPECNGSYVATDSGDLDWTVNWSVRGDLIDFVVSAMTPQWIGLGFSDDTQMVIARRL